MDLYLGKANSILSNYCTSVCVRYAHLQVVEGFHGRPDLLFRFQNNENPPVISKDFFFFCFHSNKVYEKGPILRN